MRKKFQIGNGVVRLSVCNIRTKPQHSAELATQAIMGTPVRILKKQDDWLLFRPDRYIGWVDNAGISTMTSIEYHNWMSKKKLISINRGGFIRISENDDSQIVSDLVLGSIVAIIKHSYDNKHWKIILPMAEKDM
ncbi:MAG: SH3 domain-containing protein [Saprospiraceae bacterium]